jgi:hypothetical protein
MAIDAPRQELRYVHGFTTYLFRQDAAGQWSFIEQRKLLGLFRRPDTVHRLSDYSHARLKRWWEDDGIELREIYLHPKQGEAVLICPQPDDKELAWFEDALKVARMPVETEGD